MAETILVDKAALKQVLVAIASDQNELIEGLRSDRDAFYEGELKERPAVCQLIKDFEDN